MLRAEDCSCEQGEFFFPSLSFRCEGVREKEERGLMLQIAGNDIELHW